MSNVGRPLKFPSVEGLQQKIDEYFDSCFEEVWKKNKDDKWEQVIDPYGNVQLRQARPFTITGLALYLGTTRETLLDYEDRDEFSDTIKKAKLRCENFAEEELFTSRNTAGVIFNMVNNYKWKNRQDVEANVTTNNKLEDFFK